MAQAFRSGAARLAITGNDPSLLSKEDPEKVSQVNRATSKAYRPALELITRHEINRTIVARATPAWAAAVFPDQPLARRTEQTERPSNFQILGWFVAQRTYNRAVAAAIAAIPDIRPDSIFTMVIAAW